MAAAVMASAASPSAEGKKRRKSGAKAGLTEAESPVAATPEGKKKRKSVEAAEAEAPVTETPQGESERKKKRKSGAKALDFTEAAASPSRPATSLSKVSSLPKAPTSLQPLKSEELSALLEAAERGDVAAVEAALTGGSKVDEQNRGGYTALHLASAAGAADVVTALLRHQAKPDLRTGFGQTSLHLAALAGGAATTTQSCLELLLEARADPRAQDGSTQVPGLTALEIARRGGARKAAVEALEKAAESKGGGTATRKQMSRPLPDGADAIWQLLLSRAASK